MTLPSCLPLPALESLPFTWSLEHLLLHEVSSTPLELSTLLTRARKRHAAHRVLLGKLTLSDSTKAAWEAAVRAGYVQREATGYTLTKQGEVRLDYLYATQVIAPYLKRVERSHGRATAQRLTRELMP